VRGEQIENLRSGLGGTVVEGERQIESQGKVEEVEK
jgi:hypothetical protein